MNTPPRSTPHASVSPSLSKDATPPRVSAIPALSLCPAPGSGTPAALCRDAKSSSPPPNLSAAPSRHSSSPVRVQGFRSELPPAGPESVSPGKVSTHPSATAPGLPLPPSPLLSASLQRSKPQLTTTQHDKPAVPNLLSPGSSAALKASSAGADAAVASVSPLGSRPHESQSTYTPPAVSTHLSASLAASLPTVAVTSAAPESPTAQPSPTLPLPTTQASRTAPVSTPHSFLSAPLASSASSGSNAEQSCPNSVVPRALRIPSPEQEPRKASQTSVSFEQIQAEGGVSPAPPYPVLDHTPVRKAPHFHRVEHSTDEESFNSSSQYEGYSSFATPSRIDVSSILENSSLMHDGSSCADKSTDSDNSFLGTRRTSPRDRSSHTEAGASTDVDTTRGSVCSLEASRSNTLDSSKEGGMSETQRTLDSLDSTGRSRNLLESSLNSSQVQDSSVASADVSRSHSFMSPQQSQKGKNLIITESEKLV